MLDGSRSKVKIMVPYPKAVVDTFFYVLSVDFSDLLEHLFGLADVSL